MPWGEVFVRLAMEERANRRKLCRRLGIDPAVGCKRIGRWAAANKQLVSLLRRL
jgi:hypothetical protein